MAKSKRTKQVAIPGDAAWLSLKEAAVLCKTTPADLRHLIENGKLRAFTIKQGGHARFRLLRSSLVDAGLIGDEEQDERRGSTKASVDLLELVRDQNQRISALEDQRAILAGQLGVALERLRSIDERLAVLEYIPSGDDGFQSETTTFINGKGGKKIRSSILKVVAVAPTGKRWKRDKK